MVLQNGSRKVIQSMGLVFGDIGTSPLYTVGAILLFLIPSRGNILGLLSLIIWTLVALITVQYAWLAMHLGSKGEGGTIVLRSMLAGSLKPGPLLTGVSFLTIIGIALFMGDGVITPAISILSAVEGIQFLPDLSGTGQGWFILIAAIIAILLFSFQKRGTEKVAWAFGPIMLAWFLVLAVTGTWWIAGTPEVLLALNPWYAGMFLLENSTTSFVVLSAVVLCATGGEALYADMGHLGRRPILGAWAFVFPTLILTYLGQGVYALAHPGSRSVLFEMIHAISPLLSAPFLILAVAATVIASQAMISGMFSIVYQAMNIRIIPRMKVDYTSQELRSQIYIDAVNWLLLAAVLLMIVAFRSSEHLAAAYGLAVTGTMTISAILMTLIFFFRQEPLKFAVAGCLVLVDALFLVSTFTKIPYGAYWTLILGGIPLLIIVAFMTGQERLQKALAPVDLPDFLREYTPAYRELNRIEGTALFFSGDIQRIPRYIARVLFRNQIIYKENILVSIRIEDYPFGVRTRYNRDIGPGLHIFTITAGYMEILDIVSLLREAGIRETTIFYGTEDILSDNPFWKIYSLIKKVSPPFVEFYKLPVQEMHGVVSLVEM